MNTNSNFNIGNRLYQLRKEKGFSQEKLALKSNITPTYLGLLERNLKNPTVKVLGQICDSLEITFNDFFSMSPIHFDDQDVISTQISVQISNCSLREKKLVLKIVKDIVSSLHSD